MINIDFETRSRVNLITEGVYKYATDPSTEVICMAYSIDGEEPELWLPNEDKLIDLRLARAIRQGAHLGAWNSTFERLIWDYIMEPDHDWPAPKLEQWRCTAYMSRCSNLPNALGNAARCLNVWQQKDSKGHELIKLLSVPTKDGTFCKDPELLEEFYDYCLQDVRAEMSVRELLREPTPEEWEDFFVNERVNDRGFKVDIELATTAQVYAEEEEADLIAHISDVTAGAVVKARGEKLKAWVVERLNPEQEELLVKYRDGERKLSLDKHNRFRLLQLDDLDPDVREVVECSDFAQKSSVGKFKAMTRIADPEDEVVCGAILCNGAAASGRFSSRGLQIHNFARDCMDNPLEVREDFIDNIMAEDITDYYELPMMTVLSRMLRASIIPKKGNIFLDSDWSSIEGRVAPWLCNNPLGEQKLNLYWDEEPVYEIAAASTFGCNIEDVSAAQRQVGKVEELAFQFGGGANAFLGMARNYGVAASREEAEMYKDAWRAANPWASDKRLGIWANIEKAVYGALAAPKRIFEVGRLRYFTVPDILCGGLTLYCQLPCGRVLTYPDVRVEMRPTPWDKDKEIEQITVLRAAFQPKVGEKEWPRTSIYGGLLFENAVQGTAASLLRRALRRAQKLHLPIVLHVHDQLVAEVAKEKAAMYAELLSEIMHDVADWAVGLPLKAEVLTVERFGK